MATRPTLPPAAHRDGARSGPRPVPGRSAQDCRRGQDYGHAPYSPVVRSDELPPKKTRPVEALGNKMCRHFRDTALNSGR
jgi:hypothetical protein